MAVFTTPLPASPPQQTPLESLHYMHDPWTRKCMLIKWTCWNRRCASNNKERSLWCFFGLSSVVNSSRMLQSLSFTRAWQHEHPFQLICHFETSPTAPVCQRSAAPDVQGGKKETTQDNINAHAPARELYMCACSPWWNQRFFEALRLSARRPLVLLASDGCVAMETPVEQRFYKPFPFPLGIFLEHTKQATLFTLTRRPGGSKSVQGSGEQ